MNRSRINHFLALTLLAGLVLSPAASSLKSYAGPEDDKGGGTAKPAAIAPEKLEEPKGAQPETERISGTIYKLEAESKMVGILVQQKRAYKRYKLALDEKSLILVGGQPSNFEALAQGQAVEASFFKKGKQVVIDTIVVAND